MKNNKISGLLKEVWKNKTAYLFLLPLFVGICIFKIYPPIMGIVRSFTKWDGTSEPVYIGLDNYRKLVGDEIFLNSIPTMFKMILPSLLIGIVMPLIMAELIFNLRSRKLQEKYRFLVLIPIVAPGVVSLLLWKTIYEPNNGLFTTVLRALRIMEENQVIDWLGSVKTVIPAIIFMGFPWVGGISVLIYTSGLMNITTDVIEASRLDGCSTFRRIFAIDIPNIWGQIRYFLIMGLISGLQAYGNQVVLTKGGPGYTTYVPGYYMYKQAFTFGNMGYSCAIGTVLFVFIIILTILTFRLTRSTETQGER